MLTPRPHQVEALRNFRQKPYLILAMAPGTGKSAVPLFYFGRYPGKLLIVCPSYLIPNWRGEIQKVLGESQGVFSISQGKDIPNVPKEAMIVLISYDLARKAEGLFSWCDLLVLDEAHNLKSMSTKRSQFFHRVIYENSIPRVLMMTGTPMKNRVDEIYSLMAIANYNPKKSEGENLFLKKYPDAITFADQFSYREEFEMEVNGRPIRISRWKGHRNVPELKSWLKPIYFQVTDQVLGLGETTFVETLVSDAEDKELLEAFNQYLAGNSGEVNPTAKADAALRTTPFTVQYVKDLLEKTDCVVIFTDHVASCEALGRAFDVTPITGKISVKKRMEARQEFLNGKTNVLVATISSFSEGHDLTRSANLVFNDISWVPGSNDQAIYRIKRITSTRSPVVHFVFGSPQAQKIKERVISKKETIKAVLG